MKKGTIGLSVFGFIILFLFIGVASFWSHRNTAVELEERINAQYISNKSEYDNMWKKFKEMAQIPDMQAEHFKEVYTELISGRYDDPNLLFKMIQEDNPKLDGEVYTQLQREIAAGRDMFNNSQKKVTDLIREYNTFIRKKIIMSAVTGRKTMDANEFIVTSARTNNAFNVGEDDEIKFND